MLLGAFAHGQNTPPPTCGDLTYEQEVRADAKDNFEKKKKLLEGDLINHNADELLQVAEQCRSLQIPKIPGTPEWALQRAVQTQFPNPEEAEQCYFAQMFKIDTGKLEIKDLCVPVPSHYLANTKSGQNVLGDYHYGHCTSDLPNALKAKDALKIADDHVKAVMQECSKAGREVRENPQSGQH